MIVDLIVDKECYIFLTDHHFTCPVFSIEILCACHTESFVSMHPFEKYSAVEGYKGKCSTNRLPSERSAYMMKINPAKSSGCEDYTIYVKDGKPPEFWSCPFVITLACHYIFVNKHMIFSINKIVMRGNCTGSSSCVSGYKDGSLLRLPSGCYFV